MKKRNVSGRRRPFVPQSYKELEARKLLAGIVGLTDLAPVGLSTQQLGFGASIDVSGDFAVASASGRDFNPNGREFKPDLGRVVIFERDDNGTVTTADDSWSAFAELPARDQSEQFWGADVAIAGNRISVSGRNRVEIYEFDGTSWNSVAEILPAAEDQGRFSFFGAKVEISEDTLVVTDPGYQDGNSTVGRIYSYELNNGNWELVEAFTPSGRLSTSGEFELEGDTLIDGQLIYDRGENGQWVFNEPLSQLPGFVAKDLSSTGELAVHNRDDRDQQRIDIYSKTDGIWEITDSIELDLVPDASFFASAGGVANLEFDGDTIYAQQFYEESIFGFVTVKSAAFYQRDSVTGVWTSFNVDGDLDVEDIPSDNDFAIFGNEPIGGLVFKDGTFAYGNRYQSENAFLSGAVDIYNIDTIAMSATPALLDFAPVATEVAFANVDDSFGGDVAIGDDFIAVGASGRRTDGEYGTISVYAINRNGTPTDGSDDTYDHVVEVSAVDFGSQAIVASGNTLFAADARNGRIVVLEYTGTDLVETGEILIETPIQFTRIGDLVTDGNRLVVNFTADLPEGSTEPEQRIAIYQNTPTGWVLEDTISHDLGRPNTLSLSGERLVAITGLTTTIYQSSSTGWTTLETIDLTDYSVEFAGRTIASASDVDIQGNRLILTDLNAGAYYFEFENDQFVLKQFFPDTGPFGNFSEMQFVGDQLVTLDYAGDDLTARVYEYDGNGTWILANESELLLSEGEGFSPSSVVLEFEGDQVVASTRDLQRAWAFKLGIVQEAAVIGALNAVMNENDASATGTLTISDPNGADDEAFVATMLDGAFGGFELQSDGQWNFTPNAAIDELNDGEVVTEEFSVASVDGTMATFELEITGQNDLATFLGTTPVQVSEDATTPLTGQINVVDPDVGESTVTPSQQNGNYGVFEIDASGQWSYTVDNAAANIIPEGLEFSDNFPITSLDGTRQVFRIKVTGANDIATITGDSSGTIDEDDSSIDGVLGVVDPDLGESLFAPQSVTEEGNFGTFQRSGGIWSYTVDSAAAASLNSTESVTEVFEVASLDGSATALVTITVEGIGNDHFDDFVSTDSGTPVTFNVLDNDQFTGEVTITSNLAVNGGDILIGADGNVTYTPSENANALGTDSFALTFEDENGNTTVSSVHVTINPAVDGGDSSGFNLVGVDDYFNDASGTGGFIATYEYTVSENSIIGEDLFAWIIQSGYSGEGQVVNTYTVGFNGQTSSAADGTYDIGNIDASFRPELTVGDSFTVSFQVDGAGFDSADFSPEFFDSDPEPVQTDPSDLVFSVAPTNDWGSGFVQNVEISNVGGQAISGWQVILDVPEGDTFNLSNVWGATAETLDNGDILFTNLSWNADIPVNGSINFGFLGDNSTADAVLIEDFDFSLPTIS